MSIHTHCWHRYMEPTGTILIVDDSSSARQTLEALLARENYRLAFASSGAEALDQSAQLLPDLILLDVMMPGMDGFEVCRTLRATPALAEVPVLMVTALDDRESRLRGLDVGADDFITKPFDKTELRMRIRSITRLNRYRRLLDERARFKRLIELSPDGILIVDSHQNIHLANPAIIRMLHLSDEQEVLGKNVFTFLKANHDSDNTAQLLDIVNHPEAMVCLETTVCTHDGAHIPVEVNAGYVVWDDQPTVQLIVRDITERKRITEQLQHAYQAAEDRARRFRLLVEIGRDLISAHELDPLLQMALERAIEFIGYDGGSILLLHNKNGPLEVHASAGEDAIRPGTKVNNLYTSVSGKVIAQQRPLILEGHGESIGTTWRSYTRSIPSTITLPLVSANGQSIGVLTLKSTRQHHPLSDDDLEALQLLASELGVTVENSRLHSENARLLQKLAEREVSLLDLVEKLLNSQEEERRRVAYELHDGLAQVASSAYQHLQTFASHYRPRAEQTRNELQRTMELSQRVVKEARQVIAGLRPTVLDDFGLESALRMEIKTLRDDGWNIAFEAPNETGRLPSAIETTLYRVAQEALTNVRKHACTREARLALICQEHFVRLEVQDWGCGFHVFDTSRSSESGEHIGLMSMKERMALLDGTCTIHSTPGSGTLVVAEAPLPGLTARERTL